MASHRADYALLTFMEHLGGDDARLDVDWADFVGNRSSELSFEVSDEDPTDAYLELQLYEVDEWGHELVLNGETLSGFDVPPVSGWQYWMDAVTGAALVAGENTLQVRRDPDTADSFVVGNAVVNWRAPVS